MNSHINRWAWAVALAGFLFGFDTVVISGANLPTKELWELGDWSHGFFIMSMALWGTVIGSLFGNIPCDKLGRKPTLFIIALLYLISALGSAFAMDPYSFSAFRFLGGLGVGASTVAVPMYIAEIAPAASRGRLVARYQFLLVLGILLAFFSNYLLDGVGGVNDWRYMLGAEAIPAIILPLVLLGVPESPRWLILAKGELTKAKEILAKAGVSDVDAEVVAIEADHYKEVKKGGTGLFSGTHNKALILAFLIAFFNQVSGINFVLYYAPQLFEKAKLATDAALGSSIALGIVNLVFTYVGLYLIDRIGRKGLMYIGSIGYILTLGLTAYAFYADLSPYIIVASLSAFIGAHAIGQGAVIWVFISEIFPNDVRAAGASWGTGTHWVFAALITLVGPTVIAATEDAPWMVFAGFAGFMVLQLLFVAFMMPETKGKTLEEIGDV